MKKVKSDSNIENYNADDYYLEYKKKLLNLKKKSLLRNLRKITNTYHFIKSQNIEEKQQNTIHSKTQIKIDGKNLINFSGNDYLGFSNYQPAKEFYKQSIEKWGIGSGSSRLLTGTYTPHIELEKYLAKIKKTESALTYSSGYATSVGVLSSLFDKDDILIYDKFSHASLIDGGKLSGAKIRTFKHNDLKSLKTKLLWATEFAENNLRKNNKISKICVITESIYSMDGDISPLMEICELKKKFKFLLLVDEAHGFGIFGATSKNKNGINIKNKKLSQDNEKIIQYSGLVGKLGLNHLVDLQMGTFSKSVGLSGGYVCAKDILIQTFINNSKSFMYSTAPSPAMAETILYIIEEMNGETGLKLRSKLINNIKQVNKIFANSTFARDKNILSPIIPIIIGDETRCYEISKKMISHNIFLPAIRYPTVSKKKARLRISISANHSYDDIEKLKILKSYL